MSSLSPKVQIANRCGLNIQICDADNLNTVYQRIDFANISSIKLDGDTVFATGGAAHSNKVGFYNKLVGEFTLSTQILTQDLMCLMSGKSASWDGKSPIVFKNRLFDKSHVYAIVGDTVWKDKTGNVYEEKITFHRVKPRIAYKRSFVGEGEVASVDIVFDLLQNNYGQIITFGSAEPTAAVIAGTLKTSYGYVTANGTWVLGSGGAVNGASLQL